MNPTRRQLIGGTAALLAMSAVGGCAPRVQGPGPELLKLTIGLTYIPNVQFSPFYLAVSAGHFEQEGLDVTLRHHGAQEDSFGALLGGKEDVLFASGDEAIVARAAGSDIATFGTAFQTFPGVLLTAADSGIATAPDLRGRTIGIPGHYGSSYYTVLAALHLAGLGEDDVTLQDIGYTQVAALSAGRVDVVVGYSNNESVQFATAGFDVMEIAVQDPARPTLVGPGLITVGGRFEDDVLRRVNAALLAAEKEIVENPQAAIDATLTEVPTLSEPGQQNTARAVLEATSALWLKDGEPSLVVDTEAFVRMGDFLAEVGIIESAPGDSTLLV